MFSEGTVYTHEEETAINKFKQVNTELAGQNRNNNNWRLPDLANQENEFWAQPEEEPFYIPQPPSTLLPPLPFSDISEGLHDLPDDANWLFGETDNTAGSVGMIEADVATDDMDLYADLASPDRSSEPENDEVFDASRSELSVLSPASEAAMLGIEDYLRNLRSTVTYNTPDGEEPDFDPVVQGAIAAIRHYDMIRATAQALLDGTYNEEEDALTQLANGNLQWDTDTGGDTGTSIASSSRWDRLPSFSSSTSPVSSVTLPNNEAQTLVDDTMYDRDHYYGDPDHDWSMMTGSPSVSLATLTGDQSGIDMTELQADAQIFTSEWDGINEDMNSFPEKNDNGFRENSGNEASDQGSSGFTISVNHAPTGEDADSNTGPRVLLNNVPVTEYVNSGRLPGGLRVRMNGIPVDEDEGSVQGQSGFRLNLTGDPQIEIQIPFRRRQDENQNINETSLVSEWATSDDSSGDSGPGFNLRIPSSGPTDLEADGTDTVDRENNACQIDDSRWLYEQRRREDAYETDSLLRTDDDVLTSPVMPRISQSAVDMRNMNRKRKLDPSGYDVLETRSDTDLYLSAKRLRF